MAVTAAKLIPRNNFSLENAILNRLTENRSGSPEENPNWMRGFYDNYDRRSDSRERS